MVRALIDWHNHRSGENAAHCAPSVAQMAKFLVIGLPAKIGFWVNRNRQRPRLREMVEQGDAHLLKDIGASCHEAWREAEKWFWSK